MTEAQDYAKSPHDAQCDELSRVKKRALINKNQSQLPLKTINKLMVKDESCVADDLEDITDGNQLAKASIKMGVGSGAAQS